MNPVVSSRDILSRDASSFCGTSGVTRRVPLRRIGPVVGASCSSVYHLRYEPLAPRCVTKLLSNV